MEVSFYVGKKYYAGCEKIGGGSSCDVESASFVLSEKPPRRKSDGSFCRYILHNKLCKLLYSELEDSSRKSNAYARSERKSDHHPDNNYDDPCDLKNDGHRDHVGDQSTNFEIRNVLCLSNT